MTKPKSRGDTTQKPAIEKKLEKGGHGENLSDHIGRELRAMFDDVVAEPVPERFQQLLEELERKQSKD